MEVRFHEAGIEFSNYPYPPASVYPSGIVNYELIREVILGAAPPEIRVVSGEVLFIPATLTEQLREVAKNHGIPVVSRVDVWSLILEPFLDTEFDDLYHAKVIEILEANGISRELCEEIRCCVAGPMLAYNSHLWEWVHLGLADVLDALRGNLSGKAYRLPDKEFATFYWKAMEIANRAGLIGTQSQTGG